MKFATTLGCGLLAFAAGTEACIRVHAYLSNDIVIGDRMSIKIYDNYDLKCSDGATKRFASGETKWEFKCGEDDRYEVHLTDDGHKGYVWNHNAGWKADLILKDSKHTSVCQYKTGLNDRCAGYVSNDESVLWDGFEILGLGDCDDKLFNTETCGANCDISEKDTPCAFDYNGRCSPITS
ncbi:hypothetical protein BDV40DRAFT_298837 [Aspergillus tamarii]|uniref:Uncharacterized protein n=1 Tax=Aspergillus tamarii TaxID=41984 RepID=A0A5N6V066_ASPTM|nr:hypothetical protein BDV40DRAFT_298837 [Aspergillus tamarii]